MISRRESHCTAIILIAFFLLFHGTQSHASECVILLHASGKTSTSMQKIAKAIQSSSNAGDFFVVNMDYPSTEKSVAELAASAIAEGLNQCRLNNAAPVNFITHSLGGILVRQYFSQHNSAMLHRVVMLAPPNQGSQVVDLLARMPFAEKIYGISLLELGTGKHAAPQQLPAVDFDTGIIAGTLSSHPFFSLFLPGVDDGRVSVSSTKVAGMKAFITVPAYHESIMEEDAAIALALHYLTYGNFHP